MAHKANKIEYLEIAASDDTSTAGNFSSADAKTLTSIIIQEINGNGCHFTVNNGSTVVAVVATHTFLGGNESVALSGEDAAFDYFAGINAVASSNFKLRITGIYR